MGMARRQNGKLFVTTMGKPEPREIEVRKFEGYRNCARALRALVAFDPVIDEPRRRFTLDLRFRHVGKERDPSFRERPNIFKRAIIPVESNGDGFLVVAARDGQILQGRGLNVEFTNLMDEALRYRDTIVALIEPRQKKAELIADLQPSAYGSWSALDEDGRNLGNLSPTNEEPLVIHTNLLKRWPEKGKAIVRVEMKLSQ